MSNFHLDILTPYKTYFSDDVTFLRFKNDKSTIGILPNHADYISTVEICEILIQNDNISNFYACGGGLFKISKNNATLLVKSIENKDEIDVDRANNSKNRAEERLKLKEDIDVKRAQASLQRALVRLQIAKGDK